MPKGGDRSERVIVLAPLGRDGELLCRVAQEKGLHCEAFPSVETFCEAFRNGSGVALLTEEALYLDKTRQLSATAQEQPGWSEVPFVVLTSRGEADARVHLTLRLMEPLRNVTVMERPVRPTTIASALQAALRDRRRQYEVRDTLEALQRANIDLERRVDERTAALLAKITELEGFSYSVSHDMRTPLRSIVGNAHIVLEEESNRLSQSGREGLLRLSASAMKMAQLVDDLLEFARLGAVEPKRVPCDLSEMVRSIGEELARGQNNCSMQLSVQPNVNAKADARLIGLAIQNLLENACKYRKSGATAHISFGEENSGPEPVYYVRDDGIGFDMAYAPKIFRAFERLHRDGEYPGTGIGLANVKRIIERHGGKVWAKAAPDEGATFFFTLGSSTAALPEGPSLL